jgi:hypothetical protein
MSKMIIVKKGNTNPTGPMPCPWVVDVPTERTK